jgi:hypothetical protein
MDEKIALGKDRRNDVMTMLPRFHLSCLRERSSHLHVLQSDCEIASTAMHMEVGWVGNNRSTQCGDGFAIIQPSPASGRGETKKPRFSAAFLACLCDSVSEQDPPAS